MTFRRWLAEVVVEPCHVCGGRVVVDAGACMVAPDESEWWFRALVGCLDESCAATRCSVLASNSATRAAAEEWLAFMSSELDREFEGCPDEGSGASVH